VFDSRLAAALIASLAASPLQAEDSLALDRFVVAYGQYETNLSADASYQRKDRETVRSYGVSEGHSLPFVELTWRPFGRHQFRGAWFDHGRDGDRTLSENVEVGDTVYPVGAELTGELAIKVLEVDYTYWAWLSRRNALGPFIGVVRIDVDSAMSGTVTVEDIGAVDLAAQADESITAPKIGASYVHAFNEHLRLTVDVGTFERSIPGGNAQIWDTALGLEWYPWKNAGFALRHARTRIDADVERGNYDGSAEVGFSGWQLLARLRW